MHQNGYLASLPEGFRPQNPIVINDNIAMSSQDGMTCYLDNLEPIFAHPDNDRISRRVIMGMLHVVNHISQKRLAEVFEVHRNTVSNSVTRYRVGGLGSFYQKKVWSTSYGSDPQGD